MDQEARRRRREEARRRVIRRRRLVALAAAGMLVALFLAGGLLAFGGGDDGEPQENSEPKRAELPRGDRQILPRNRVVAYYGAPQDDELGILGIGSPRRAARRLERQGRPHARPRGPGPPPLSLVAGVGSRAARGGGG